MRGAGRKGIRTDIPRNGQAPGIEAAFAQAAPARREARLVDISDYPALRLLAWNRSSRKLMEEEALALYERTGATSASASRASSFSCAGWRGATRIVLELDEYRESADTDFLCADAAGFRALREGISQVSFGTILRASPSREKPCRRSRLPRWTGPPASPKSCWRSVLEVVKAFERASGKAIRLERVPRRPGMPQVLCKLLDG